MDIKLIVDMVNDPTALYICISKRQMISSKIILLPPSNTFYWFFNAWVVKILYTYRGDKSFILANYLPYSRTFLSISLS